MSELASVVVGLPASSLRAACPADRERIEAIRELNRATLKATGETMSEEDIAALRPNRYLDRRCVVESCVSALSPALTLHSLTQRVCR